MPIPEFLAKLRARVGTELMVLPSVAACVFDERGRLLMALHAEAEPLWAPPGGIIEPDESPADAAVREVREEVGLDIRVAGLIGVYGGPEFRCVYPNGDQCSYVTTVYGCTAADADARPDGVEISDVRWVTEQEAARLPQPRWTPLALPDVFAWWRRTFGAF